MLKVTVAPWVELVGFAEVMVTVLAGKDTPDHALSRLVTLTEPRPVALS